ncbi:hypothetical protein SAY86_023838 [Trapa natans]|uniref:WAT1-related protein n=1 Tax=Trapa natans TaxID=22666 RepID=A0AAN7M8N4_TRANT|nr:hypothetical protein SAY86_023838 [Trapa natans]
MALIFRPDRRYRTLEGSRSPQQFNRLEIDRPALAYRNPDALVQRRRLSFTLKKYPAELSLTALICLMGMVEGAATTLVFERDMTVWQIGWDSKLLAVVYSGVVCSGMAYYVQGFVMKERGPVFVTSFSPFCMIITALLGLVVLSEQIHLGSIIGAIFIVFGLYTVVWGKSKDQRSSPEEENVGTALHELPVTDVK